MQYKCAPFSHSFIIFRLPSPLWRSCPPCFCLSAKAHIIKYLKGTWITVLFLGFPSSPTVAGLLSYGITSKFPKPSRLSLGLNIHISEYLPVIFLPSLLPWLTPVYPASISVRHHSQQEAFLDVLLDASLRNALLSLGQFSVTITEFHKLDVLQAIEAHIPANWEVQDWQVSFIWCEPC